MERLAVCIVMLIVYGKGYIIIIMVLVGRRFKKGERILTIYIICVKNKIKEQILKLCK